MPLYGVPQAGSNRDSTKNLTCVNVGDSYTLLDGTEVFSEVTKSVAIARGEMGSGDNGMSFFASGMGASSQVDIEASNEDDDSLYTVVGTIASDSNGNGAYTDVGRAAFYRVVPSDTGSPATGIRVTVQR